MPEISVIIPAHIRSPQQLQWLNEAIDSVNHQSFQDTEIVVVDDASPVGFVSDFRLSEKSGPGVARNAGVEKSRGQWLVFLDADDRLSPFALADMYAQRCECGVVYGDVEFIGDQTGYMQLPEFTTDQLKRLNGPLPITALHHRSAFESVGGFAIDLNGLEDIEYWIRLAKIGICGKHINAAMLEYRKHNASRTESILVPSTEGRRIVSPALVDKIRQRHADIYAANSPFTLQNCKAWESPIKANKKSSKDKPMRVEIKYIGLRQGGFMMRGQQSHEEYYIDGKGAYLMVDERDVNDLLNHMRGGLPEFERVIRVPPRGAALPSQATSGQPVVSQKTLTSEQLTSLFSANPLALFPPIIGFGESEALKAIKACDDLVDLRIWLAEERSSAQTRITIENELRSRFEELSRV